MGVGDGDPGSVLGGWGCEGGEAREEVWDGFGELSGVGEACVRVVGAGGEGGGVLVGDDGGGEGAGSFGPVFLWVEGEGAGF